MTCQKNRFYKKKRKNFFLIFFISLPYPPFFLWPMATSTFSQATKDSRSVIPSSIISTSRRCLPDEPEPLPSEASSPSSSSGRQTSINTFCKRAEPQPLMPCNPPTTAAPSSSKQVTQAEANPMDYSAQDTELSIVDSIYSNNSTSSSSTASYAKLYPAFWEGSQQYSPNVGGRVYGWLQDPRVWLQASNAQPQTEPTPEWCLSMGKKVNAEGTLPRYAEIAKNNYAKRERLAMQTPQWKSHYCKLEPMTDYMMVVGKPRMLQNPPAATNNEVEEQRKALAAQKQEMDLLIAEMRAERAMRLGEKRGRPEDQQGY